MKRTYSKQIDDELANLYEQVDYEYDEMFDKDVNKELVGLYKELSDEMTFEYDDGLEAAQKKIKNASAKSKKEKNFYEDNYSIPEDTYTNDYDDKDDYGYSNNYPRQNPKKYSAPKGIGPKPPLSKARKAVLGIILTLAIGVFLISAIKLISIKKGYDDSRNAYKKVDENFFKGDTDNIDDLDWDFSELFSQNPDVVGYIYCPDLVSYPVVQGSDNSYYLKHLFTHEWNDSGSIFMDCNLPNKFESRNCIIYGHNMKDGSMFSKLLNYSREGGYEFYKDHKEFHIFTTDDHHYVYKVLSVFTADVRSNIYATELNDEQFLALLDEVKANSIYDTEHGELTTDSKIITLSTCLDNYMDEYREVVILVRDREVPKKAKTETQEAPAISVDE